MDNTTAGARPMGRTLILWIAALSLAAGTATSQGLTAMDTKSKDVLWFDRPAPRFMEAAPIGGGLVGAMVFGGTSEERLALNHKQLWRATKRDAPIPDVADRIPQIRSLFLDGKAPEGARLAREVLDGPTGGVDAYQPVGDLLIRADVGEADEYVQALDMARGVHQTAYTADGVAVVLTSFASGVDHVVVAEVSSSAPIALEFELARIDDPDCALDVRSRAEELALVGRFPEGVCFAAVASVRSDGGAASPIEGRAALEVSGARRAWVVVAMAVGEGDDDVLSDARDHLCMVPRTVSQLRERHVAAHRDLYRRCDVMLGAGDSQLPTNARVEALSRGETDDPDLIALMFRYGRYLMISGSRPGDPLPTNLQGIWSDMLAPPWNADFHFDVNLQMNYWPAEVTGLSECADPLFDFCDSMIPEARKASRRLYGAEGICFPITTSGWGTCMPREGGWDVWVGAASWTAMHYWERWESTRDIAFLRDRVYPFLKECARFWETYLVEDAEGRLVAIPSQSPENTVAGNVSPVSLVVSATMDVVLCMDVLQRALEAREILDVDEELGPVWRGILAKLPPVQIGKHGQLQEWLVDYEEAEPGHRHYSHLVGFYPGGTFTREAHPDLAQAARVSMERRLAVYAGGWGATNSYAACILSRLGETEKAYGQLIRSPRECFTSSLMGICSNVYQIDANFALTASVTEMLIQSHDGVIRVLPTLPQAWPDGSFRGMRARGGFEVDADWTGGELASVRVRSVLGQPCRLLLPGDTDPREIELQAGEDWAWPGGGPNRR